MFVLQTVPSGSASQVAGTFALFALFFAVTAHIAARNVLGDVELKNAVAVGPVIPAVSFVFVALEWPAALAVPVALAGDFLLVRYLYGQSTRLAAYLTLIHVVVSIILGVIVFGLLAIIQSAPG
ncbi:DUF7473 family protein [Salinigranum salinum]|uniref:DUF7473 family protein n=1 Tax=Salinigranum salinum TaxID=1364937 RepID=UPI001261034A|nr:hypothetical protein [Salinigranum salinum]